MTMNDIERILQKAFAYGYEVGKLHKDFRVSHPTYEAAAEVQQISDLIKQREVEARASGLRQFKDRLDDYIDSYYIKLLDEFIETGDIELRPVPLNNYKEEDK